MFYLRRCIKTYEKYYNVFLKQIQERKEFLSMRDTPIHILLTLPQVPGRWSLNLAQALKPPPEQ